MKVHSATRWLVFATAVLLLFVPGASAVYQSPYGLRPLALWSAVAMLSLGYLVLFIATDLLVQRTALLGAALRIVAIAVLTLLLFAALPLVGLVAVAAITFASPAEAGAIASAALTQKYLHHLAFAPILSTAPLAVLAVVAVSFGASPSKPASRSSANAA